MKSRSLHQMIRKYFLLAALIPFGLFSLYFYQSQVSQYNRNLDALIENTFALCNNRIRDFKTHNITLLTLFTNDPIVKGSLEYSHFEPSIQQVIHRFDATYSSESSIALGLENGSMYTKNRDLLPAGYDPRVRPWYKLTKDAAEAFTLSEPYENAVKPGTFSITFSAKVFSNKTNEFIGVAGLDVDMKTLLQFGSELKLPESATLLLLDASGRILGKAGPVINDAPVILKDFINNVSETSSIDNHGHREHYFGEEPYVLHYFKNQETGWFIIAAIPKPLISSNLINILVLSGLMIIAMILISVYLARRIDRIITAPIDHIVYQLSRVDLEKDLSPIEQTTRETDETLLVRESINVMIQRISEQRRELIEKQFEIGRQYMEIEALYEETTAMNDTLNDMVVKLNDSWKQTIRVLSNAIEANDEYTRGHCDRVTQYALELGSRLELDRTAMEQLEFAALLHDIGKVSIPYHILNKPDLLTDAERLQIQQHPLIGHKIIADVPFLHQTARFILCHHENVDGSGYPNKIMRDDIPLEARILSVADAFDAMTTVRSYRKLPLTYKEALDELRRFEGIQFDPIVVAAMANHLESTY